MSDDLCTYLQKAKQYLAAARLVSGSEFPNGAVTGSYYAFFWAIRGLSYEKDIITKRHSGLKDMFSLHYIKIGEIPGHYLQDLEMLFDRRQLADYVLDSELPTEEINECIRLAEDFITFVETNYA